MTEEQLPQVNSRGVDLGHLHVKALAIWACCVKIGSMANVTRLSTRNILLQLAALVALIGISIFVSLILFGNLGPGDTYRVVVITLLTLSYMLILPSFILVILGRAKSHALRVGVAVTSAIALVALVALGIGLLQDVSGINCNGVLADRCVDSAGVWILLVFIFSPVFFVANAVTVSLLGFGLVDEYRKSQSSQKMGRRK